MKSLAYFCFQLSGERASEPPEPSDGAAPDAPSTAPTNPGAYRSDPAGRLMRPVDGAALLTCTHDPATGGALDFAFQTLRRGPDLDEPALIAALDLELARAFAEPDTRSYARECDSLLLFGRALRHRLALHCLGGERMAHGRVFGASLLPVACRGRISLDTLCAALDIPLGRAMAARIDDPADGDGELAFTQGCEIVASAMWLAGLLLECPEDPAPTMGLAQALGHWAQVDEARRHLRPLVHGFLQREEDENI